MHGKNGAKIFGSRSIAQLPTNQRRIEIQGAGIDVHEDRRCARPHNCAGRGEEAECCSDDRVSGLDAGSDERQPEGFRSGRATDGRGRSRERGDLTLERLNLRTENEALRIAHARDGSQHVFADAIVLAAQVQQRDGERDSERNGLSGGVLCRLCGVLPGALRGDERLDFTGTRF